MKSDLTIFRFPTLDEIPPKVSKIAKWVVLVLWQVFPTYHDQCCEPKLSSVWVGSSIFPEKVGRFRSVLFSKNRNRNRTILGRFLGRFLVITGQLVSISEGSVRMFYVLAQCDMIVCCPVATRCRPAYAIILVLVRQTCLNSATKNN